MHDAIERSLLAARASDGAAVRIQLHAAPAARATLYWLPALGVGIGPNERYADAFAQAGIHVAIHEWRGLGGSDRRAGRDCDWGYRELLDDIDAGVHAVRAALPGLPMLIGGHSLGGQLALIDAARRRDFDGVLLVASGHPYWRAFAGARAWGVRTFAAAIPLLTALAGYFPGTRLGFAGREASRLMREWAITCRRGDYGLPGFGGALDAALAAFDGRVHAARMEEDRLAPAAALAHLRTLAPRADWHDEAFGRERFPTRRPDHFGWLREPASVVESALAWMREAGVAQSGRRRREDAPTP